MKKLLKELEQLLDIENRNTLNGWHNSSFDYQKGLVKGLSIAVKLLKETINK
jgi:hypothetical protein